MLECNGKRLIRIYIFNSDKTLIRITCSRCKLCRISVKQRRINNITVFRLYCEYYIAVKFHIFLYNGFIIGICADISHAAVKNHFYGWFLFKHYIYRRRIIYRQSITILIRTQNNRSVKRPFLYAVSVCRNCRKFKLNTLRLCCGAR